MSQPVPFDITPEQEASKLQFFRRQLFASPAEILPGDIDLAGKTAIVTGANGDLGRECSRQLLRLGLTKLILAVRDEAKGAVVRDALIADTKLGGSDRSVEVWKLDYASYDSVVAFARRVEQQLTLDIAILNAGVTRAAFSLNPTTGHEEDLQTNYLSSTLLLLLLVGVFKKTESSRLGPGRIVLVSSDTAAWAKFNEKDQDPMLAAFKDEASFEKYERYATTKLMGQLFITEVAKRVPSSLAVINCANPGLCYSGNQRELNAIVTTGIRILGRSPAVGSRALVHAAVVQDEKSHGQYVEDGEIRPMAPFVYSPDAAPVIQRLWDETMQEFSFAGVQDILAGLV
ncbi:NAD(P)-binding protein [Nemania sp. FL0916]|nr:NAD(P)-binding protein [Nemania sp. FL0916]